MPMYAGRSAAGKGGAKKGYMMPHGKMRAESASGGGPPKSKSGMVKSAKKGK